MKTSGKIAESAPLRGEVNGKYYLTYAKYLVRFFEEYLKRGVPFWGMTIQNEPLSGHIDLDNPFQNYSFQNMYLSLDVQRATVEHSREFARDLLVPALRASWAAANVKVIAHDDQRDQILDAAQTVYNSSSVIDGLAVHWYVNYSYTALTDAHNVRPDKFILPTEACTGWSGTERWPLLGDWARGMEYAHDIINNLLNWAIGWTDWNLALDLGGGPNWADNFVDSPVVVNASADEFYKQPMFYVLGHFSKFIPRGSVHISSSSSLSSEASAVDAASDGNATADGITHALFKTPRAQFVLVVVNEAQQARTVRVRARSKATYLARRHSPFIR